VGRILGVTGVTIGAWEGGKNDAGTSMLYKLADLYGVCRAWLLAGEGPMRCAEATAAPPIAKPVPPSMFHKYEPPAKPAARKRRRGGDR